MQTSPAISTLLALAMCSSTPLMVKSAALGLEAKDKPQSVIASPVAGPNRPANVPDDYVITPFGYFHPSCVLNLSEGERLLPDGRVQHADGSLTQTAASCSYPRYAPDGTMIPVTTASSAQQATNGPNPTTPEINGWIEAAAIATSSSSKSYGGLIAVWDVPQTPHANDGQVLYFFPGLEDIYDPNTSILQPVLAWYQGWSIASWNCCIKGVTASSPGVTVHPGDVIYGSITNTCSPGTLSCRTWNVLTLDLSTGKSTTLENTPSEGQTFDWAFGGVLEPYYVVSCEDFPPERRLRFEHITVFDENLHSLGDKDWSTSFNSTVKPQCDFGLKADNDSVVLDY